MDLIYITNDVFRAQTAQRAGVDRVMVDLEVNGKVERQGHLSTVISRHTLGDVPKIADVLGKTQLMVRVNPLCQNSAEEVSRSVESGAQILMLPMFISAEEVRKFVGLVAGRAKTCLLLETGQALARVKEILEVDGIDEIHVGLNDLHLALKLDFMFEILSGGLVEYLSDIVKAKAIKFGFGGIARIGHGVLDSSMILTEHIRLGSTQVILSRDFGKTFKDGSNGRASDQFCDEVKRVRLFLSQNASLRDEDLRANQLKLTEVVRSIGQKATTAK